MLGFLKPESVWKWTAFGKHPVARDFFTVGDDDPILKAFSSWLENGYKSLDQNQKTKTYSWRFWIKGPQKDTFICGVGRDSSDSLGRPYPFLIIGTGELRKGEKNWDMLPFACERTWNQMDALNRKRGMDFGQLEQEVLKMEIPFPMWRKMKDKRVIPETDNFSYYGKRLADIKRLMEILSEKNDFFIRFKTPDNILTQAISVHSFLKLHIKGLPNAVFIGGSENEDYMAVFKGPPGLTDFKKLWSVDSKGDSDYGTLVFG